MLPNTDRREEAPKTARFNPYAAGKRFIAIGPEVINFLFTLSGVEQAVALAWIMKWDRTTCGGQLPGAVPFRWTDVKQLGICKLTAFKAARVSLEGRLLDRVKTGRGSSNEYLAMFSPTASAESEASTSETTGSPGRPSSGSPGRPTRNGKWVAGATHSGSRGRPSLELGCRGDSSPEGDHRGVSGSSFSFSSEEEDQEVLTLSPSDSIPEVETRSLPGVAPSSRRLADTPHFIWCKYIGSEDFAGDTPKAIAARLELIASPALTDAPGWNFRPRVVGLLEKHGRDDLGFAAGQVLRRETPMTWISFVEAVAQACAMQNEPTRVAR